VARALTGGRVAGGLVVLLLLAGAVEVARGTGILLHDSAKPASIADALRRFRAGGDAAGKLDGVYLYATRGQESVDALGGAHHRYPATTSITVLGVPCGVQLRWDALKGRSTTWTLCAAATGAELGSEQIVHTFFGQVDRTGYVCAGTELLRAGPFRCRSSRARESGTVEVVGRERVEVGGKAVQAEHVRTTATIAGADQGRETVDWWLSTESGLPLRLAFSSRTSRKTFVGRVHYAEDAVLRLDWLTPRR